MSQRISICSKRYNILSIFLLIIVMLLSGCSVKKDNLPKAFEGTLDLTNWNFERDGFVKLDGQWELYSGQLLEPKDFMSTNSSGTVDFFEVPNSYTTSVKNESLPKYGYSTMRLVINIKEDKGKLYGIRTQNILTASKIWINGQLATSAGVVTKDVANAIGSFERQLTFFRNDQDKIELVIQMSNFNNITGKVQSMFLGDAVQIKRDYIIRSGANLFVIGCLFIIGIYHLALFSKRPKFKEPLYFGMFCLFVALRNVLVSQRVVFELYPNISFSLFNKIAYLTVYLSVPFLFMFFREIFTKEIPQKAVNIMKFVSAVVSLITIFTHIEFYDKFLIYYEAAIVMFFIHTLFAIVKAAIQRTQGASIILFGFIVFMITVVHDVLVQMGVLITNSLVPLGLLIFVFSQAYMLAARFSNAFTEVEKLLDENKAMYRDELTGILNRRGFYDQGRSLYKDALNTGKKFILFYGDLNKLKVINDSFGHNEGDKAIKATAEILKKTFDQRDVVARISGDEFIAIAVSKASEEDARQTIELINSNFSKYNLTSKKPYTLSISMGYSIFEPYDNISFEELMNNADTMLYTEKSMVK